MGEHSFDIEGIEPAKAHFINEVQPDNESDEQDIELLKYVNNNS